MTFVLYPSDVFQAQMNDDNMSDNDDEYVGYYVSDNDDEPIHEGEHEDDEEDEDENTKNKNIKLQHIKEHFFPSLLSACINNDVNQVSSVYNQIAACFSSDELWWQNNLFSFIQKLAVWGFHDSLYFFYTVTPHLGVFSLFFEASKRKHTKCAKLLFHWSFEQQKARKEQTTWSIDEYIFYDLEPEFVCNCFDCYFTACHLYDENKSEHYHSNFLCSTALRLKHTECLKTFLEYEYEFDSHCFISAAESNNVEGLDLYFQHNLRVEKYKWNYEATNAAAKCGSLEALQWFIQHGCEWNDSTLLAACEGGQIHILQYLHSLPNVLPPGDQEYVIAAQHGQLDCLKYIQSACDHLHLHHNNALYCAVNGGHLECVKYLLPFSDQDQIKVEYQSYLDEVAQQGHIDVLEFMYDFVGQKIEWKYKTAANIAKLGHAQCLAFVLTKGCPYHSKIFEYSAQNGHFQCFQYAYNFFLSSSPSIDSSIFISNTPSSLYGPNKYDYQTDKGRLDCCLLVSSSFQNQSDFFNHQFISQAATKGCLYYLAYIHQNVKKLDGEVFKVCKQLLLWFNNSNHFSFDYEDDHPHVSFLKFANDLVIWFRYYETEKNLQFFNLDHPLLVALLQYSTKMKVLQTQKHLKTILPLFLLVDIVEHCVLPYFYFAS